MDEKYVKDSSYILKKINQAFGNSIYVFDLKKTNMAWLNERVGELYGYRLDELKAMGDQYLATVIHPDDHAGNIAAITKAMTMSDDDVIEIEYRFKDKSGVYHWVNDRVTCFSRNEKGEVTAVLGVATNIDDRKQHAENLSHTIEKLNLSLSAAKMGTWDWNLETNELNWDDRMYEIHEATRASNIDPIEISWKKGHREDLESSNYKILTAAKNKQDCYITYRFIFTNGEVHHIKAYARYSGNDNEPRMYGVAWDSTEEVLTERQIAEAEAKLISSTKMAALGEMSGGIAHEINNPLTVIQARAFQLTQMLENNKLDPEKVKQAAESISRTADKIARIIRSLRSFAREGSSDPFEIVSIKKIVEETLEFCRTRFYNHSIEVEVEEIDPEIELECRLIQIEQVLLNLLNNAFDAIQNYDEKWIKIKIKEEEEHIQICVIDSGTGISEDVAEKIMQPFFTTKGIGKGTGLGLSISSGIIRSHHGELILDSKAENTTFVMRLPRWQNEEDQTETV